ncbi:hypothetical protein ASG43_02515 [Aureimonas sp. Leaf454]|uniref:hypothetical protein n=1 Tax=Aureimonas sp. Leaf454 TaxID=1736381 RepID=UPI0006F88E5C|nr:hypothetical protein [Aureimonas sp. Leaf454]KQT54487.1 hypothetical protein ASG43_02515 [Aureimonas sp. Leaf454]
MAIAALWGLAEATLFVIVADVWIGFVALERGWRAGLKAAVAASLGAALGGLAMMLWSRSDPGGVQRVLAALPAIDGAMVRDVAERYEAGGLGAAFTGSFSGIPYKLYAAAAGASGTPIAAFVLLTPLIRLPRFCLVAIVAGLAGGVLRGRRSRAASRSLYAAFWSVFYIAYFSVMP